MAAPIALTEASRSRRDAPLTSRELTGEAVVALPFAVACVLLVVLAGPLDVVASDVVLLAFLIAVMGRLQFETGAGSLVPTQLAFVPMLFVLPPAIVPLVVAAGLALESAVDVVAGRRHASRLVAALGDAWFAVGPALVFVLAGIDAPALADWPIYLLALMAQFAGDLGSSSAREWIGRAIAPRLQLDVLREVWLVDVLLAPIGLLAAFAGSVEDRSYLLVLPLGALLAVFARERRERIGTAIQLSSAYRGTTILLADVLSEEDEYTGAHSRGVVELALAIADELRIDGDERRLVEFGAMLHDIGKISTPKEILHKPGPLGDDEWETMRRHTIDGQRMLDRVGGTLHDVGRIVRASHERYDGGGYPDGLHAGNIPLAARVICVADAYSAMTTRRIYREPLAPELAEQELRACSGTQFDPAVVVAALVVLARDPDDGPPTIARDAA